MALRARLSQIASSTRFWYAPTSRHYTNGKSQDSSGSIRDAGGAFSKKEKAVEDQYFHNLEVAQLNKIKEEAKEHHEEEIAHHKDSIHELEEQIQRHQEKIQRHKGKMDNNK